jgi:hypothetical protein
MDLNEVPVCLRRILRGATIPASSDVAGVAMSGTDAAYNFERYRKLLAEADNEPKRLAFIELLIEEKARDRLANQLLRGRLPVLDKPVPPAQGKLR